MSFLSSFWGTSSPPSDAPSPDRPRTLVLYQYASCPYCRRVLRALDRLGLEVELRDTLADPTVRKELLDATGRTTVPCLFIDGEPLFESLDIIAWLEAYKEAGHAG